MLGLPAVAAEFLVFAFDVLSLHFPYWGEFINLVCAHLLASSGSIAKNCAWGRNGFVSLSLH